MIKNKVICIDPGHGGIQPGAVYAGHKEKDATLDISMMVKGLLEAKGARVVMTRESDVDVSLRRRCDISNEAKADAFVSIHLNAAASFDANGAETWMWGRGGAFSHKLAKDAQTSLIAASGARDRGVRQSTSFYVLKHTTAAALVVECGFLSNKDERRLLFDPAYQSKLALGIARGIEKAFE